MSQTAGEIHVTHFSDASGFDRLRPYWNELLATSSINDPFLTWEWQSTWWSTYGPRYQLWLLVAWENENPVGIFPLMRLNFTKHGIPARGLCVIGKWDIDHCGVIVLNDRFDIVTMFGSYLASHRKEWDILRLYNCCENTQQFDKFLKAFSPNTHLVMELQEQPHLFIPLKPDWQTNYVKLSGKLKRKLRSKYSKLQEKHRCSFVHLRGDEITEKHFKDFFEIGLQSRFPHLYRCEEHRLFHLALAENMKTNRWVSMNLLYIDGVPSAYHYGYIYNKKYYAWRTAYLPQFEQFAPGHIILNDTLEHFAKEGLDEFDFLRGNSRYKREWTDSSRVYFDWQIIHRKSFAFFIFIQLSRIRARISSLLLGETLLKGAPVSHPHAS